jgi:transcription initiation factor TFIID TATA-box-binding protein
MPKTKAIIKIQNVVASATVNQKVDLNAIVKSQPGVERRPEQFPGLVFRLKRPKTATLIFNSGKMVCTRALFFNHDRAGSELPIDTFRVAGTSLPTDDAKPET